MNAEPKNLEKFDDIKAELSARNQRWESERVLKNTALSQRYAKKIQLLFPHLTETPDAGRVYLQRRHTAATMAGIYALSSTMSPELPCKASDIKEVLILLNRYSPTTAQDYPPPENFKAENFGQAFTQRDLQTLILRTLQLTTVDFDEAWPTDTPWVQVNSQLQQMIGKQLEQNPNPKTRARTLDVVRNLNPQDSDPDQLDYLDQITKVICSRPKPKFDLSIMKKIVKIPLPRPLPQQAPPQPETIPAVKIEEVKRGPEWYQKYTQILADLAFLYSHQPGDIWFTQLRSTIKFSEYPGELIPDSIKAVLSNLETNHFQSEEIASLIIPADFGGQLPEPLAELRLLATGKDVIPLYEAHIALKDIMDNGLRIQLASLDSFVEDNLTTREEMSENTIAQRQKDGKTVPEPSATESEFVQNLDLSIIARKPPQEVSRIIEEVQANLNEYLNPLAEIRTRIKQYVANLHDQFNINTRPIKDFTKAHPRESVSLNGNLVSEIIPSDLYTAGQEPRPLHNLLGYVADGTVPLFVLNNFIKDMGKAGSNALPVEVIDKLKRLAQDAIDNSKSLPTKDYLAVIRTLPEEYITSRTATFNSTLKPMAQIPREQVLAALRATAVPLPPKLAELRDKYETHLPKMKYFSMLLLLIQSLAINNSESAHRAVVKLADQFIEEAAEYRTADRAVDDDYRSRIQGVTSIGQLIPSTPPLQRAQAELLVRFTHRLLFSKAQNNTLQPPNPAQLEEIWNLLARLES